MYKDISSEVLRGRVAIQEAKRNPLEGLDKLAMPDTMVHGQELDTKKQPTGGKTISTKPLKNDEHRPSDSDIRIEEEPAHKFDGANVPDPLLKGLKTEDSLLE